MQPSEVGFRDLITGRLFGTSLMCPVGGKVRSDVGSNRSMLKERLAVNPQ